MNRSELKELINKLSKLAETLRGYQAKYDDESTVFVNALFREANLLRRRVVILDRNLKNQIIISEVNKARLREILVSLDEKISQLISKPNGELNSAEFPEAIHFFQYGSSVLRSIIDGLSNESNDALKQYQTLQAIDEIYHKSKMILNEINKEYEKLSFYTDKLGEQNNRIDELEKRYRKSIATLSFDEEGMREKQSIIESTYEPAKELLGSIKTIQDNHNNIIKKYNDVDALVKKIKSETADLDSILKIKLNEVDDLTDKARTALGGATTVQLGGHFKDQYDKARKGSWFWALLGGVFLLGAIGLCIYTVFHTPATSNNLVGNARHDFDMHYLLSRLLIAPLFLIGAWFCSTQYIKQKYIIEDYAYKKVLSLSLLSIKSEIEKTGEANTTEFIRAVQSEIIKSPLDSLDRKHLHKELKLLKTVQTEAVKNILSNFKDKKKKNPKDSEPVGK